MSWLWRRAMAASASDGSRGPSRRPVRTSFVSEKTACSMSPRARGWRPSRAPRPARRAARGPGRASRNARRAGAITRFIGASQPELSGRRVKSRPMAELRRSLTLFDMTMIAIGGTIGSGIFLTPSLIAHALPSPWLIMAVWVVGGLMAMAGALTFAELAALMPRAGGEYVYLTEAYGGLVGFLFGWAYFLVCNAGGLGALSVAFATYFGYFVPLGAAGTKVVAITGLLLLTTINVLGVKAGAIFSDVFTVLKIAGIAALVAVGFALGSSHTTSFAFSSGAVPGGWARGSPRRWSACSGPPAAGSMPPTRRPRSRTRGARSRSR